LTCIALTSGTKKKTPTALDVETPGDKTIKSFYFGASTKNKKARKEKTGWYLVFVCFFFVPLRFLRNAECGTVRRRLGELRIGDGARRVAGEGDGQGVARAAGHFLDGVQVLSARSEHGHAPCSDSDIQTRSNETNTHTRATVENCREPEIPPVLPFSALPLAVVYLSTKEQNRVFLGLDRT